MTTDLNAADQNTVDAAYYRGLLHDILDRGADLVRRVHEQALGDDDALGGRTYGDPIVAFERIARTVRRTIVLARHIASDPALLKSTPATITRTAARARIIREVEDAIHQRREPSDAALLNAELAERLDDPELEFDLQSRPIPELIAEICQDLGIAAINGAEAPSMRRTPEDIKVLQARAAAPPARPAPPTLQLVQGGMAETSPFFPHPSEGGVGGG